MMKKERVAIYLRKSRGEEEDLIKHKTQLIDLCNRNNWTYDIYQEIGSGASYESRTEIKRLLKNIGNYKKLLVVALDRLSRTKLDYANIQEVLRKNNVEVITPSKKYNLNDDTDIMLSDFEGLIAQQEYRLIRKRMMQGKVNGVKLGNWINGYAPIPYKYDKNTKELVIVKEDLKIYRMIVDMCVKDRMTPENIAYKLNKMGVKTVRSNKHNMKTTWQNNTINRILRSMVQLGYITYNGEQYKGTHTPVKTIEEHEKILEFLNRNSNAPVRRREKYRNIYRLSGLVHCENCKATLQCSKTRGMNGLANNNIRTCQRKDAYGNKCGNRGIKTIVVCHLIKEKLQKQLFTIKESIGKINYKEMAKEINSKLEQIDEELKTNERKLARIKLLAKELVLEVDEAKKDIKEILASNKYLELLKDELQAKLNNNSVAIEKDKVKKLERAINIIDKEVNTMEEEEQINKVLRSIIKEIVWYRDNNDVMRLDIKYL